MGVITDLLDDATLASLATRWTLAGGGNAVPSVTAVDTNGQASVVLLDQTGTPSGETYWTRTFDSCDRLLPHTAYVVRLDAKRDPATAISTACRLGVNGAPGDDRAMAGVWETLQVAGTTNAAAELTVEFGRFEDFPAPATYTCRFANLRIEGDLATGTVVCDHRWEDVLIDAGVLYHEVGGEPVVLGVSRGGFTFDPGKELELVQPDGAPSPIATGRVRRYEPVISGVMLEFSDAQMAFYEPGNTETTATDVPFTWTPRPTGQVLTEGEYLTNVWLFLERGVTGYIRVAFARALCRKYTLVAKPGDEAGIAVEIAGVLPVGSPLGACPYTIAQFAAFPV